MNSDLPLTSSSQFSSWNAFKHHIPHFLMTMLIDVILPLAIFFGLQNHIKPVYTLILAGAPPFFMVIFKAILFNALGFIISAVIRYYNTGS